MPSNSKDSMQNDLSAKDEKAAVPLAELELLSSLRPPPVPFVEKEPVDPGRWSFQSTIDAYNVAKKGYDDSKAFYKQTTVAAKKAEYNRLYQEYEKQFDTPFKKLFQIPQGKVPPTMDLQVFSQNLFQVLQQKDYKSDAKPQPKPSNNKLFIPFSSQLDLFIKTSQPLLEGLAKGNTIGLTDLASFKDIVRGRYSMDVWIPDQNSANTALLFMQSLNVLASPDTKSIPGFGNLLERKTDTLAGLTLAPFVDRDKTLYENLLPYLKRNCITIATALNQYFEQHIKLPKFAPDAKTDEKIVVISAKLTELAKLYRDFSLVTPFGDYTPTPLDDHTETLSKQLESLIEIRNANKRPSSPTKSSTIAVAEKLNNTAPSVTPVPSMPAAGVVVLPPATAVPRGSKVLVARTREKHSKKEEIDDLRTISNLNGKIAQVKIDLDQKKGELKHAKDFENYQRLLRRHFHDRVIDLTNNLKYVSSVDEKERLANELKDLANVIHMEDAAVAAKQQMQRHYEMFRDIGMRADAARRYASNNDKAEEKAQKLEKALTETITTLDNAVAEQKKIIQELKEYLENVGIRTSTKKIKLAKDFMAALELCVDGARVERKLITNQYSKDTSVDVKHIATVGSGSGIYATSKRNQLKRPDYFLPPIASMGNAVTAVDSAQRRFKKRGSETIGRFIKDSKQSAGGNGYRNDKKTK